MHKSLQKSARIPTTPINLMNDPLTISLNTLIYLPNKFSFYSLHFTPILFHQTIHAEQNNKNNNSRRWPQPEGYQTTWFRTFERSPVRSGFRGQFAEVGRNKEWNTRGIKKMSDGVKPDFVL